MSDMRSTSETLNKPRRIMKIPNPEGRKRGKYIITAAGTFLTLLGLKQALDSNVQPNQDDQNIKSPNSIVQTVEQRNWNEVLTASKPEIESNLRKIISNGVNKQFIHRPDPNKGLEFANGPVIETVKLRHIDTLSARALNGGDKITFREDASVDSNAFPVKMDEDKDYYIVPLAGEPYKGQWGSIEVKDPQTQHIQESGYWGLLTNSTGNPMKIDGKPRYVSASQFTIVSPK